MRCVPMRHGYLRQPATLADERQYCKPRLLADSACLHLVEARHPVLEQRLPAGQFVANSVGLTGRVPGECPPSAVLPEAQPQVAVITGPNMAGKSTYMRQIGLCVILAQIGSFIPATEATVGLADALYTRIGAVDDLSQGQSTFMVEMHELAHMLHNATHRSLLILDEVGRGTSTYDGVAIAYSVVEHLVQQLGARTLFATHYHELNVLEAAYPGLVANFRVAVAITPPTSEATTAEATEDSLVFLHKVEPGATQRSYGVHVAKLAGLPASVVQRADAKLMALQRDAEAVLKQRRQRLAPSAKPVDQLGLFTP
jgi:DNA mismatch repair protein MutS